MIDKAKVIELRKGGLTYKAIGDIFGTSRQRVHQIISGYPPRSRMVKKNRYSAAKVKAEVLTYYGNGKLACVRCGFNDARALSIDHIAGNGSQERKDIGCHGNRFYYWLINNNYPEGYQTLCMNCQWVKRTENHEY